MSMSNINGCFGCCEVCGLVRRDVMNFIQFGLSVTKDCVSMLGASSFPMRPGMELGGSGSNF